MATVQRPTVERPQERYVEFDEYIDFQLDKARNGIKWTDILAAAAGAAALLIGYLVLFVAADQWAFAGGVPQSLRVTLLCVVGAVSLGWLGWKVVWPYLRRVSDLYAARMLEAAEPDLRGSLFGLVDARRAGRPPAEEVRRALEKRAATTLAEVDIDAAVDRRPLMRTAYVLLAVVLVACAYAVLSPKRVGPSILRALLPTSARGVATRTEILSVKPGDAAVLAGSTLDVSVMIRGETPERVMLYYSTADRRFADEPVEMRLNDETTREYRAVLVGDAGRGLSQDLTYRVTANDDSAGPFAVTVEQPPAATVSRLDLQYPPYTGLEPATRDLPPIDAIEGTNVTLTAKANRKLKSAKLAFADDEKFVVRAEEVPMRVADDGVTLTATWKLAVRPDETSPTFYRIECRDADGKTNPHPAVYPIAIHKDQPPEVTLHDPKSDLERPANAVVPLLVTGRDPDFRLRELTLRLEKNGQELPERVVLWEGSQPEAAARHDWKLAPYGLKPGDVLTYYVQARDNREPEFNRRNTPKLNITITAPAPPEQVQRQLTEDRQRQEQELAEANAREAAPDRPQQEGDAQELNPPQPKDETAQPRQDETEPRDEQPQGEGVNGDERNRDEKPAPVSNKGDQDDEVIRKLLERQRRRQQEQNQKEQDDQQNAQDGQAGEQQQNGGDRQSQPNSREGGQGRKSDNRQNDKGERQPSNSEPGQPSDEGQSQNRDGQGDARGQNKQGNDTRPGQPQQNGRNKSDQTRRQAGPGEDSEPQQGDARDEQGAAKKNGAPGEKQEPRPGSRSEDPGKGESRGEQGDAENGSRQTGEPSGDPKSEQTGEAGPNARPEKGNPNDPSAKNDGSKTPEGGTETQTRPPQQGDDPQSTRKGEGQTPPNAAKGDRNGAQPRPQEGNPASEPQASDDERSESNPGRPRSDDQPPGAAERNPGKGRPGQRSQKPDSGESGTGQPNADGTPDGRRGPGDAGTQPGDQQQSDTPTGRQGPSKNGRPQQGNDAQQSGQNQPQKGQAGQQGDRNQQPERSQQGGDQSGQSGNQQGGQSNQQSQSGQKGQSGPQQGKSGQKGESGGQQGQDQSGQGQSQQGKNQQSGQSEGGQDGQSGQKGQGGQQSGEQQGPMGDGQSGQSPQGGESQQSGDKGEGQGNQSGDQQGQNDGSQKGQGQQNGQAQQNGKGQQDGGQQGGKGQQQGGKGQQQGGKGQQQGEKGEGGQSGEGGQGSQPGQGSAQQGANPGQGGTQPGPRGGQGGGQAPANGADAGGQAQGNGGGKGESGEAAGNPDPANPEYARKATDLVLKKLEDDLRRGDVDQELLKELGWTKEDMDRFAERLRKNLSDPAADETPQDAARRKEFEKMLESLSAETAPASRQARTDRVKDVRGVGTKNPGVPSEYRDAWESFTRSVAGRKASKPAGK